MNSSREYSAALDEQKKVLGGLRSGISAIKEGGIEDDGYHIDGSRDERNHTFLMVAGT